MTGRDRRLQNEFQIIAKHLDGRKDITYEVIERNPSGMPITYLVHYNIRSFCGVEGDPIPNPNNISAPTPLYAEHFAMRIHLPIGYPSIDALPELTFLTQDANGIPIPHPWHPNIRYYGPMAGHVCINMADTYTSLLWGILRVAEYLRYERYHAINEPPYPEDQTVAAWVIRFAEPNGWI